MHFRRGIFFRLDSRGREVESYRQGPRRPRFPGRTDQHRQLHETQPIAEIDVESRRHRIARHAHTGNVPAGLLTECVIKGGDHWRRRGRQQNGQPVKDRIEESMRIPGTAGTETVIGAPVDELTSHGANGPGSQMQTQADQQTEREPAGALEGAVLRKHFAPVLEQAIVSFQQVHRHSLPEIGTDRTSALASGGGAETGRCACACLALCRCDPCARGLA